MSTMKELCSPTGKPVTVNYLASTLTAGVTCTSLMTIEEVEAIWILAGRVKVMVDDAGIGLCVSK